MNPLYRFLFRALAWFTVAVTAWYFAAPLYVPLIESASFRALGWLVPGIVTETEPRGAIIEYVTRLRELTPDGKLSQYVVGVNALQYGYGLPLFVALLLAAKTRGLWWKLPLGFVVLLLPQIWGVTFDVLTNLIHRTGPKAAELGLFQWKREIFAYCYQLGTLIFPIVVPTALWFSLSRTFIASVVLSGGIDDRDKKVVPLREQTRETPID